MDILLLPGLSVRLTYHLLTRAHIPHFMLILQAVPGLSYLSVTSYGGQGLPPAA